MGNNFYMDIKSPEFDEAYTYDGNDLGAVYNRDKTILKVWAPTAADVKCHVLHKGEDKTYGMLKEEKGVWSLELTGDMELASYVYLVDLGETVNEATDPYAIASTANHERTVIIDPAKTGLESNKGQLEKLEKYTDAIIYELHVRDFSMDEDSGLKHKGKFLGLTEEGVKTIEGGLSGLDYLTSLGVTHIQLLPVYDFGSVDEHNQFDSYNWGYDPVQYSVPEGSYGTDITDPYSRIIELKKAIAAFHNKGLRVIMDVVYNHMYDMGASAFEKIVPGYYFRSDAEGNISNGSFCGNDVDSTRPMVKKFIYESTRIWIEDYGFDGFRFDLMGILDIETMNTIAAQTLAIDPNAMIYGEGWNMPSFIDDSIKATMMNHAQMPEIAHFSDIFRENIKGGTLDDKFQEGGYGSGDVSKSVNAAHLLLGTVLPMESAGNHVDPYFIQPKHTVNYVECHDNHTLWDKLELALPDESEDELRLRHRFITTMVVLSQGIPFIHAGQEFFRTKEGEHNSYISSDDINMIRWSQKDRHEDNVAYLRDLIKLRKAYSEFRFDTKEQVEVQTKVEILDNHCIRYELTAEAEKDYSSLLVLINPHMEAQTMMIDGSYTRIFDQGGKVEEGSHSDSLTLNPMEIICLKR